MTNQPQSDPKEIIELQHEGKTIKEPKEVANAINEYFINVGKNVTKNKPNTNLSHNYKHAQTHKLNISTFLILIIFICSN